VIYIFLFLVAWYAAGWLTMRHFREYVDAQVMQFTMDRPELAANAMNISAIRALYGLAWPLTAWRALGQGRENR